MKYAIAIVMLVALTGSAYAEKPKAPIKAKVPVQVECAE